MNVVLFVLVLLSFGFVWFNSFRDLCWFFNATTPLL